MTITDLLKDFIDTSKERLKTPISGAFLWSFIICNWRPLLFLLFSNNSIENKIIVINHEYCNFWAIFCPIVLATMYTLLIPKIMLLIERDLAETKDARVTKRYEAKKHLIQQKTNVAKEEFLLKSEESGNQTIQEFMNQIESLTNQNNTLQESIKQLTDTTKVTIDGLNNNLKIAKDTITEKERDINRLKRINDLVNDNAPDIHIQDDDSIDYRRLIMRLLDKSKLSSDLILKIESIIKTLNSKDFKLIERITVGSENEILITALNDFKGLDNLVVKSVISRKISNNKITYIFSEIGYIIYNMLVSESR